MVMNLLELWCFLSRREVIVIWVSVRSFLYTHGGMVHLIFFKNFSVSHHIYEF